jgi:hypothetical protein
MRAMTRYIAMLMAVLCASCAQDLYEQRTASMKTHIRAFYDHLRSDRVTAAVIENEKLEAMASMVGTEIVRSRSPFAANQVNRDWVLVKTAKQAAAENWLNLGRYLTRRQRYDEARGAYRRVLSTYQDEPYRAYADQAKIGLQDLEMIVNPSGKR